MDVAPKGSFTKDVRTRGGGGCMAYVDAGGCGEGGGSLPLRTSYFKPSFKPKIIFLKKSFHILKTIIPYFLETNHH